MGDREHRKVKVFQTKGRDSVEEMNIFLTENKIEKDQIINCNIGYFPIGEIDNKMKSQFETVITIIYNEEWRF